MQPVQALLLANFKQGRGGGGLPIYRQIYQHLRSALEQQTLGPGARLPSSRALASALGVARSTVEAAYGQLSGEGYLVPRGQAGSFVAAQLPAPPRPLPSAGPPESGVAPSEPTAPHPFQLGTPALDAFPRKLWARLVGRRQRAMQAADMFYAQPCGDAGLRQALAAHLLISRGLRCRPEQVLITAGLKASLDLVRRALLPAGAQIWVEDPCHPVARRFLQQTDLRLVDVPVDAQGLQVAAGRRLAPKARLALVTPSHQAPLGLALSLARRVELLQWAGQAQAWVVEDDYDGEFRYSGHPLPALKSLDEQDRVLYAGSFSKVLFPGLALGYLVLPQALQARFAEAAALSPGGGCALLQEVVADFMQQGHFARHIKKMRLLYARRRALLVAELRRAFGARLSIDLQGGGMHLILQLPAALNDVELAARARAAGLACAALSERYALAPARQGLLLGFANIENAVQARRELARLRGLMLAMSR